MVELTSVTNYYDFEDFMRPQSFVALFLGLERFGLDAFDFCQVVVVFPRVKRRV